MRSARYWVPVVVAVGCLFASMEVSPVVAYVLLVVAAALLFDAGTAWFAKAGGTGGIRDHHQ
jgi:hypothetical protein